MTDGHQMVSPDYGTRLRVCGSPKGNKVEKNDRVEEGRGFEPLKAFTLAVFKTAAIDHSAIPPVGPDCTYRQSGRHWARLGRWLDY